jgi:hypothetical protein
MKKEINLNLYYNTKSYRLSSSEYNKTFKESWKPIVENL